MTPSLLYNRPESGRFSGVALKKLLSFWAAVTVICLACPAAGAPVPTVSAAVSQQDVKKTPPSAPPVQEKPWQADTVPAEVLVFGQKLEDGVSPTAKQWIADYVKTHLREKPLVPKEIMEAVDQRFGSACNRSRDLGIYLAYYLAQKDDDENQRMLSYRIRDIDRESYDIGRQLSILFESEQNRMASTQASSMTVSERIRREETEQKLNSRLRELGDERQIKATQMEFSRRKMNAYLKLMARSHSKLKNSLDEHLPELK